MSMKMNEPHNIKGVISYKRSFGDLNDTHLSVAKKIGIRPLASRSEAEGLGGKLVQIKPCERYCLGSVLNHVVLHQTVIGQEAVTQMEMADAEPDMVIGCFGGGSNFAGIGFPFLRKNFAEGKKIRVIAVEPEGCPKLTRGEFQYDFGDVAGFTPLIPMYTLGHDFQPSDIHAGGLRYHGAGSIVSQLMKDGLIEAQSMPQVETLAAGVLFAQTEGIIPAPESTHAIAATIREALKAKEEGVSKTILFNLSGNGVIDLYAYEQYLAGALKDFSPSDEEIRKTINQLEHLI
jgi:tryptophan synthase beta chain